MFRSYEDHNENPILVLGDVLYKLYKISPNPIRLLIRIFLIRTEFEAFSPTLRRVLSEYHDIHVGLYTIGCFRYINYPPGTNIGRYCMVANSSLYLGEHHPTNAKTIHTLFHDSIYGLTDDNLNQFRAPTIEDDVFVGHNVLIYPSVEKICTGAMIGSGSVVSKEVIPPYAIVVGNPARVVRYRFSKKTIKDLLDSQWWEKPLDDLKGSVHEFQVPLEGNELK